MTVTATMTFKDVLADFSPETAWKHLAWIEANAPQRVAGSEGQRRAADYFAETLQEYGFEARVDSFTAYQSSPGPATLQMLSPIENEYHCVPCAFTETTSPAGVEGDVVLVASGTAQDYDGKDVSGRIVVVEVAPGPPVEEKARIATQKGATAVIYVTRSSPEPDSIPPFSIKTVWGNPTRTNAADAPQIPAVIVSRKTGDAMIERLRAGNVRARVVATANTRWAPLVQPLARLKVPANATGDFLLLGGHFDAIAPGMTNNAAGNALILELARLFAKHRDALRRDLLIGLWNGHVLGGYEGSTWFADRYWDHLDDHAVAYFNVQFVGLTGTSVYAADSTPELATWHRHLERQILGEPTRLRYVGRESEHPFFGLGLPALEGRFHFREEQVTDWDGARNGWWWNTDHDTIDKIDRDRFNQTVHLYARYVWDICTLPVLPFDFTNTATRIDKAVSAMQKRAKDRFDLDLPTAPFARAVTRLSGAIRSVREDRQILTLNRTLMRLSRLLTPAFETVGGRHAQDRRAHEALTSPIPALHAMQFLATMSPGGERFQTVYTELLRRRNRLSDALRRATDEIHEALDALRVP